QSLNRAEKEPSRIRLRVFFALFAQGADFDKFLQIVINRAVHVAAFTAEGQCIADFYHISSAGLGDSRFHAIEFIADKVHHEIAMVGISRWCLFRFKRSVTTEEQSLKGIGQLANLILLAIKKAIRRQT